VVDSVKCGRVRRIITSKVCLQNSRKIGSHAFDAVRERKLSLRCVPS
jgi:hypothetical protein